MSQSGFHGRFIWQELLTPDVDGAARFYGKLLSWSVRPFAPGVPYQLFVAAHGGLQAGMVHLPADKRGNGIDYRWQVHIGSNDVDATVARATARGAHVVMPAQDMPNVGRVAMLADPQGAHFGVYRPSDAGSDTGEPGKKGFVWNELATRDRASALEFYRDLFGWELRAPLDMGGGMVYQVFGLGSVDLGGCFSVPPDRPMPTGWLPYAHHHSADEAAAAAVAAGGKVCMGPMSVPGGGRIVQVVDPQGVIVAFHSPPAAMAAPAAATPAASKPKPKAKAKAKPKPKAKAKPKAAARRKPVARKPAKRKPARRKPATKRKATARRKVAAKRKRPVRRKK